MISIFTLIKTMLDIGNRVSQRLAEGASSSIDIESSIKLEEDDYLLKPPEMTNLTLNIKSPDSSSTTSNPLFGMMKSALYEKYMDDLKNFGPKNLNGWWKKVEEMPNIEDHQGKGPMELPVTLAAAPNLKKDLLNLRNKFDNPKKEFKAIKKLIKTSFNM